MEFPHLMRLMESCQFDTIYHEHFYYLSLTAVQRIFQTYGLEIYDVEELETHGGSLRIYAAHKGHGCVRPTVAELLGREEAFGLRAIQTYAGFMEKVEAIKLDALHLFTELKQRGKRIAAFGAAAKGNTFLNYCGIKRDIIDFVVDSNPHKQGLYLPGSLIPIVGREALREHKPDYVLILPWNLTEEITETAGFIREWGGLTVLSVVMVLSALLLVFALRGQGGADGLGLVHRLVAMEAQLRRHAPGQLLGHERADVPGGLLEGGLHVGIALGIGGVVHVAGRAVVAHLAAGNGHQMQPRIGHIEQQNGGDHLAGLLVHLAIGSALFHNVISSIEDGY